MSPLSHLRLTAKDLEISKPFAIKTHFDLFLLQEKRQLTLINTIPLFRALR